MFHSVSRLTGSLLRRSRTLPGGQQKRLFHTPIQFEKSSSPDLRVLLAKVETPWQSPHDPGVCQINAEKLRGDLQKQISGDQPLRLQLSNNWTDENAKLVMQGHPASVGGHGTTGETSRFGINGDHGVTVVAVHPEDANKPLSKSTRFLVFDADVTHSKESLDRYNEVGKQGLDWPDGMRIMTNGDLARVVGKESAPDGDGFQNQPMEVVKQEVPRVSILAALWKMLFG